LHTSGLLRIEEDKAVMTGTWRAGQHAAMQPYVVPSEGAPLLDFSTVQRMQAALIPKQMPYISTQKRTQQHTTLDRITFNLTRSASCKPPALLEDIHSVTL